MSTLTIEIVEKILTKRPANTKVSQYRGYKLDLEKNKIDINVNTAIKARKPSQYGKRGKDAEQMAEKWDGEMDVVIESLQELGLTVSQCCW